jgi:hypothetical protein
MGDFPRVHSRFDGVFAAIRGPNHVRGPLRKYGATHLRSDLCPRTLLHLRQLASELDQLLPLHEQTLPEKLHTEPSHSTAGEERLRAPSFRETTGVDLLLDDGELPSAISFDGERERKGIRRPRRVLATSVIADHEDLPTSTDELHPGFGEL